MTDRLDQPPADRSGTSVPDRSEAYPLDRSGPQHGGPVRWPVWLATLFIFGVFVAGAVWSFREQTALARSAGFHAPELLPLVIDGFAAAMAAVAWAASLDGRAAVLARLGMAVGIGCSVATNAAWAWERSDQDQLTVVLAGGVPVLSMLAFEAVLAEVRRQVQRRRGLPRPEPVPMPRATAVLLSPVRTPLMWRRLALELTDPRRQFDAVHAAIADRSADRSEPAVSDQPEPAGPDRSESTQDDRSDGAAGDRSGPVLDDWSGDRPADWWLTIQPQWPEGWLEREVEPPVLGPADPPVPEPDGEPAADQPEPAGPDRSEPDATVLPIDRPRPRRTGPGRARRTGRKGGRLTDHSLNAIEDARAVCDKFGEDIPSRETVRVAMGWGTPRTSKALAAIPAVLAERRERSTAGQPDRSESDEDQENDQVGVAV